MEKIINFNKLAFSTWENELINSINLYNVSGFDDEETFIDFSIKV